jgi:hypothetical protein
MSAAFYRAAAAQLDRYAADVDDCETQQVARCRQRLPEALVGAATAWLADQLEGCSQDLRSAAHLMRAAATAARSRAAAIEAVEAAAAAAQAATLDEPETPGEALPEPTEPSLYY